MHSGWLPSPGVATPGLGERGISPCGGRKMPRNLGIDPTGRHLLLRRQTTGAVRVFRIDLSSGKLDQTKSSAEIPNAVCVKFCPRPN
jgi:6-phosphogluconolactonase (cycloisomerase 2 family)